MKKTIVLISFFLSIVFLPWWVSVVLAVVAVAYLRAYVSVFLGGVLLDTLFAAPTPALYDSAYIYTLLFIVIVLFALTIRQFIFE